jgi:hypothetical protein
MLLLKDKHMKRVIQAAAILALLVGTPSFAGAPGAEAYNITFTNDYSAIHYSNGGSIRSNDETGTVYFDGKGHAPSLKVLGPGTTFYVENCDQVIAEIGTTVHVKNCRQVIAKKGSVIFANRVKLLEVEKGVMLPVTVSVDDIKVIENTPTP